MPKRAPKQLAPTLEEMCDCLWLIELEKRRTDPIQAATIAAARQRLEWDRAQLVIQRERLRGAVAYHDAVEAKPRHRE